MDRTGTNDLCCQRDFAQDPWLRLIDHYTLNSVPTSSDDLFASAVEGVRGTALASD